MPPLKKTIRQRLELPKSIQVELPNSSPDGKKKKGQKKTISRKEARKQARFEKKQKKAKNPATIEWQPVRTPIQTIHSTNGTSVKRKAIEEPKVAKKLKVEPKVPDLVFPEDDDIRRYEKLLGLDKKTSQSTEEEDELDSLLRGLKEDRRNFERKVKNHTREGSPTSEEEDAPEDMENGSREGSPTSEEEDAPEDMENGSREGLPTSEEEDAPEDIENGSGRSDELENSLESQEDSSIDEAEDAGKELDTSSTSESTTKEENDVHILNKNKEPANIIKPFSQAEEGLKSTRSRYVPPHLRKPAAIEDAARDDALQKLTRQVQGHLNRLSDSNIESIIIEIEEIYRKHSRNDVTTVLTKLMINSIQSRINLLDTFVILYAGFAAAIYKLIGTDFGGHFVHTLVENFDEHYEKVKVAKDMTTEGVGNGEADAGKECNNLILLVAGIYKCQVIACPIIYDFVRFLLDDLCELNVELLLKLVRECGTSLRQDDPTALKEIIHMVQQKTSDKKLSVRTKVMIEMLVNVKNNRLKRIANSSAANDVFARLTKFLGSISKKRHVMASEPLRMTLEDIHSVHAKGKWWLVGASWTHNMVGDESNSKTVKGEKDETDTAMSALVRLASEQKMNTDVRRSIFIVLMTSEDYVEACDRLDKLGLKTVQRREIARVVVRCAENEKTYNPYYALICHRLCEMEHEHRVTLQYCLWDILRSCGETNVGGVSFQAKERDTWEEDENENVRVQAYRMENSARLYAYLVAKGSLSISILKALDWAGKSVIENDSKNNYDEDEEDQGNDLNTQTKTGFAFKRPTVEFLRTFLKYIFASASPRKSSEGVDKEAIFRIFTKASNGGSAFMTGLKLFIRKQMEKLDDRRYADSMQTAVRILSGEKV